LPVAKSWKPETVVYQAEFVTHESALWQARKDTARALGGADWVCVARAGRDGTNGRTASVCGTYDAHQTYQELDIVALDGGMFIAKFDNPGLCPGDGWQLVARQGKRGQRGERGERGEKGERGPAITPKLISTKIDEFFNLAVLREDGSLEIYPLRELVDRYHAMVSVIIDDQTAS
jgi:hypothetical protein